MRADAVGFASVGQWLLCGAQHRLAELLRLFVGRAHLDESDLRAAPAENPRLPAHGDLEPADEGGEDAVARGVPLGRVHGGEPADLDADDAGAAPLQAAVADKVEHARDVLDARGGVHALRGVAVGQGPDEERRAPIVAREAESAALADYVVALGVADAVFHLVMVLLSGGDVAELRQDARAVLGVHMVDPVGHVAVHLVVGETEVPHRVGCPARDPEVDVAHKEVPPVERHRDRVEDPLREELRVVVARALLARVGEAHRGLDAVLDLVAVHAAVGLGGHVRAGVSLAGADARAAEAEREGHGAVHRGGAGELGADRLEALLELVDAARGRDEHELVAAQAEELLARGERVLDEEGGLLYVRVAVLVPEAVVAGLEVVEVDESEGEVLARAPELVDADLERAAVAELGEGVGAGFKLEHPLVREYLVELGAEHRGGVVVGGEAPAGKRRAQAQKARAELLLVLWELGDVEPRVLWVFEQGVDEAQKALGSFTRGLCAHVARFFGTPRLREFIRHQRTDVAAVGRGGACIALIGRFSFRYGRAGVQFCSFNRTL